MHWNAPEGRKENMYDMKALYEAESVPHAIQLLKEHPEAQIIAGGSDVLVQMREGKRAGAELVSIYGLDELRGVKMEEDGTIDQFIGKGPAQILVCLNQWFTFGSINDKILGLCV